MYINLHSSTILKFLEEIYTSAIYLLDSTPLSLIMSKTKKCQPDAGDRPDLIQTEPVPSIGLARQQNKNKQNEKTENQKSNYKSHANSDVSHKVYTSIPLSHVLTKTKSVNLLSSSHRSRLSGHTLHTPRVTVVVPVSGHGHGQHTPRVTARSRSWPSSHGRHTPRVTARTQSQPAGHTPHTPRVTVVVPVSHQRLTRKHNKNKQNEKLKNTKTNYLSHTKTDDLADSLPVANKLLVSRIPLSQELNSPVSLSVANKKTEDRHPDDKWLKDALIKTTKCQSAVRDIPGHTLHTPRVTVVVPVRGHMLSGHTLHTPRVTVVVPVSSHTSHTSQVTVGVPGSRRSRKQNKNKQNEKSKKTKTNYRSHVKTNDLMDSLPVANKLSVSRIPLSKELNSPVSLPVANKKTEDRHPDDKWLKDALIKTTKCQPAVRDIPGHTLHTPRVTVVVPVSGHMLSGHTLHTPRVTVVVPVSSQTSHTSQVTVGVPGSGRSRKQNKNKQNEKHKNQKSNYLSNVTLEDSVKLTQWFSQSKSPRIQVLGLTLVIPYILRESL